LKREIAERLRYRADILDNRARAIQSSLVMLFGEAGPIEHSTSSAEFVAHHSLIGTALVLRQQAALLRHDADEVGPGEV
jgi:hypothetical protein